MNKITLLKLILIMTVIFFKQTLQKKVQFVRTELKIADHLKIFGGVPATREKWPFMMVVTMGPVVVCGGSLIRDKWVLTANHCLFREFASIYYKIKSGVVPDVERLHLSNKADFTNWTIGSADIGSVYLTGFTSVIKKSTHIIPSEKEILNEMYDPDTLQHDIALILLSESVVLSDTVNLAKMPQMKPKTYYKCATAGFGAYRSDDNLKPGESVLRKNNILYEIYLRIDERSFCYDILLNGYTDNYTYATAKYLARLSVDGKLCAKPLIEEETSGSGDSGGPFICGGYLFGVTSMLLSYIEPPASDKVKITNLFTDVTDYIPWINKQFAKYDPKDTQTSEPENLSSAKCITVLFHNILCAVVIILFTF